MAMRSDYVPQVCHGQGAVSMNIATELPHDRRSQQHCETQKEAVVNNGCTPIGLRGKITT
jgi:hypothetical protein